MRFDYSTISQGTILRPNEEEFKNFRKYITSLENNPKLQDHGIVKVNFN